MQTLKYHRSVLGEGKKREKKKRNQVKKSKKYICLENAKKIARAVKIGTPKP